MSLTVCLLYISINLHKHSIFEMYTNSLAWIFYAYVCHLNRFLCASGVFLSKFVII